LSTEKAYPVSDRFKLIEGYDIYRGSSMIVALVVVESDNKKDLRLYRWQERNGSWKVDLCRMSVTKWKWEEISRKVIELKAKHNIV